jgi:hypothetical protein
VGDQDDVDPAEGLATGGEHRRVTVHHQYRSAHTLLA